jgi:hypothetical protein
MLRRTLRHGFTILSALSLLLCVATAALAVGSWRESLLGHWYWLRPGAGFVTQHQVSVIAREGRLGLLYSGTRVAKENVGYLTPMPAGLSVSRGGTVSFFGNPASYGDWSWRGYGYKWRMLTPQQWDSVRLERSAFVIVPSWVVVALTAMPVLIRGYTHARHRRAMRRLATNLCPTCGYDLRASSERCPECGTTAQKST